MNRSITDHLFPPTERKYKEAKVTSEEIKSLKQQGESVSNEEVEVSENIKTHQQELLSLTEQLVKAEEEFKKTEVKHGKGILLESLKLFELSENPAVSHRRQLFLTWKVFLFPAKQL